MPILSFAALFMMLKDAMIRALNIVKKSRVISITIICISFANILFNFILIPAFMTTGASLAYLLTQVLSFGMLYYFAQKFYPINYEIKKIGIMLLLAGVLTVCALMLNHFPLLPAICLKFFACCISHNLVFPELLRAHRVTKNKANPNRKRT